MQISFIGLVVLGIARVQGESAPIGKVLGMLAELQSTIIQEGEVVQKEYAEFAEWCEDRSRNFGFEIETAEAEVETLKATIDENIALINSLGAKVDEVATTAASDTKDLKAATVLRAKEAASFVAEERELVETIDMINRATGIVERQMNSGASMMQIKRAGNLAQVFQTMVQASLIGTGDATRLTALVQASDRDVDEAPDAPAAETYESQSGAVVDTLQDLADRANAQLADLRKEEAAAKHNFEMSKQSLEADIKYAGQDLDEAKKGIAESTEKKATAEGDLGATSKDLAQSTKSKSSLRHDCILKASAFEAETKSRGEEFKAIAAAKAMIQEATAGAAFGQLSFVQVSRSALSSRQNAIHSGVFHIVHRLARKHRSRALALLASQVDAAMQSSDAFEKVRGLISDMITKLEKQAGAEATKKAYCDQELAETKGKKGDKSDEIEKLSTKIGQASAKAAKLKQEVAALESSLSSLAKSQAEMDKLRKEENTAFKEGKAALQKGLTGLQAALKVLNEYYGTGGKAHEAADGAANGIIALLEVVEADFSKNLVQITSDEDTSVAEYQKVSNENDLDKAAMQQDIQYKTRESKALDKTSAELGSDRSGVKAELDAVLEYFSKIKGECIAKAGSYETRKARRESELEGLNEALQTLESETALIQHHVVRRTLRGASRSELLAADA